MAAIKGPRLYLGVQEVYSKYQDLLKLYWNKQPLEEFNSELIKWILKRNGGTTLLMIVSNQLALQ